MARPKKQGLDYFPFDTDFFEDDKIVPVTGEFGLKGEIVAIKLLCAIYRNGYFIEWSERTRLKFLRDLPGISADLLKMIVARLVQWGLFDEALFHSAQVLTSKGIQRRYFAITNRRRIGDELPHILINVCKNPVSADTNPRITAVSASGNAIKESKDNISSDEAILSSATTTSPSPGAPALEYIPIDQVAQYLQGERDWIDTLCMNRRLEAAFVGSKISEFATELKLQGETIKEKRDCKRHFINWLRKNTTTHEPPQGSRTTSPDITHDQLVHDCKQRVARRLARTKTRQMGPYGV